MPSPAVITQELLVPRIRAVIAPENRTLGGCRSLRAEWLES
jgi:hypothetical protein